MLVDEILLCENEDSLSRFIYSSKKQVFIGYKSLAQVNVSLDSLSGFKLYFEGKVKLIKKIILLKFNFFLNKALPIREPTTIQPVTRNNSYTATMYFTKSILFFKHKKNKSFRLEIKI